MEEAKKIHLNTAQEKLKSANEELFKPKEDVVTYLVCKNSQYAIEAFLKGYLSHRGFATSDDETIEHLIDRCIALDDKFKKIDINVIDCKTYKLDSRYCSGVDKVSSCFDTADSLDTLLRQLKVI